MLNYISIPFGVAFVMMGILGFIPTITPQGHLLGIFHVNAFHNWFHILSGAVALYAGVKSEHAAQTFFKAFGVVYGLVAVLGMISGDAPIFGVMANNTADVWLHTGIAAGALFLGFFAPRRLHAAASH